MKLKTLLTTLFVIPFLILSAQDEEKKWDVANPPGEFKEIEFTTDEGTWMNLDVSPDGRTLVFDMMGDIYTMPVSGGKAKLLLGGLPYEVQPRFSPDGKKIVYTSDRGGGDNVWTMGANGENSKQITKESFRLLNNPVWTADGEYIIARKHFSSTRSLGAGEMWMYHTSGGEGMQITIRKNDQQDVNEPSMSSDGKYLYYSEDMYAGGGFQYNKDPNSQIFQVKRYDMEKGETKSITGGPGGACRPQISNNGKMLAFIKRVRTKTVLYLHDLETGEEWPIFDNLSKDQQEAWTIFGIYTGYDWTQDDKHIVIWGKGKIWKVEVSSGKATEIPFSIDAKIRLQETVQFQNDPAPEKFDVNVIRHCVTAPNDKYIIFNAVGHIWKMDLPKGKPKRLTKVTDFEFEPDFSKNGKSIVYTTWNDEEMGAIMTMDLASGISKKITTKKGIYRTPRFSPDGKQVVYRKEGGNMQMGFSHSKEPGIYIIASNGGTAELVVPQGENPRFNTKGDRIQVNTGGYLFGGPTKAFKSFKLDGTDEKIHFNSTYANQWVPSPDNKWIAFAELHKVYIAPMPKTGKPLGLTAKTKAFPVAQVGRDAGINLHWSKDSKKVHWTLGNEYFTDELTERFLFLEGAVDSVPPMDSVGLKIKLELEHDKPEGKIAFTNARIITMNGDEVIENGTILIENNKILAVGKTGEVKIDGKTKTMDMTGKTIMPGFIDVHAHVGNFYYGLSPQKQWHYYANLAYGVTTTHDPSSNSEMIFSHAEMIRSGQMLGPRLFSTGTILYGADGDFKAVINSLEDAKSALRRNKAYGAFSVKSYNQPRRDQRQQIIQAARELDILVVPEGGSFFYHNMSMILDGHTGVEHNIPVAPLYNDVIQVWKETKTHNTPTLIVNYGGVNGEYYFYQKTNVWEKERLLNFTPRAIVDSRSRHRTMIPDEEYENGHILVSQSCNKLQENGVNINLGSHGQLQGLGAHWEIWMFAQGGMSNHQSLRAATMNGAVYLGMEDHIGSLEKGKLADLLIMNDNPLDKIENTESIIYTMINGRLYDADTLNEIGNYDKKRGKFFWEINKHSNNFPWHYDTQSFLKPQCHCGG
jgi:imidazolonepropionase-like amidohydrolase/Tol biopolymer transport system component